jgi:hypothetical protein
VHPRVATSSQCAWEGEQAHETSHDRDRKQIRHALDQEQCLQFSSKDELWEAAKEEEIKIPWKEASEGQFNIIGLGPKGSSSKTSFGLAADRLSCALPRIPHFGLRIGTTFLSAVVYRRTSCRVRREVKCLLSFRSSPHRCIGLAFGLL